MDDVYGDDVTAVNASEDGQFHGKETDFFLGTESRNMPETQEIDISREGNYQKSSVQEFMDLLDGKSRDGNLNIVDRSDHLYDSFIEGAGERVQELTLDNYSAVVASRSDNALTQTNDNELVYGNQLNDIQEVRNSKGLNVFKGKGQATSSQDVLAQQSNGHSQYTAAGQYSCLERDTVSQNALPFAGVRTKMISKTGFSEYFIKSSLKGKGVVYRGQKSPASHPETKRQKAIMNVAAPVDSLGLPIHLQPRPTLPSVSNVTKPRPESHIDFRRDNVLRIAGASMYRIDESVSISPRPALPPSCNAASRGSCGTDSGCGEDSLRAWLKSRNIKVQKVDSLGIFRNILDLVDSYHSKGEVLLDLRPSCFKLLPSKEVKYDGRLANHMDAHTSITCEDTPSLLTSKRPRDPAIYPTVCAKKQKLGESVKPVKRMPWFRMPATMKDVGSGPSTYYSQNESHLNLSKGYSKTSSSHIYETAGDLSCGDVSVEEKWYESLEEHLGMGCTTSSNIYSIGILLFELLSYFESEEARASAMSNLRHRILPPNFLSEYPMEAGFCLWHLHPEPSLRPTTRDVLQSEVVSVFQKLCEDDLSPYIQEDETESELLLHFLLSVKEEKQKRASKLTEDISCIQADIIEAETRRLRMNSSFPFYSYQDSHNIRQNISSCGRDEHPNLLSGRTHSGLLSNISHLESAYFSVRSQVPFIEQDVEMRPDTDLLRNREHSSLLHREDRIPGQLDTRGAFFDGLSKYARYNKLEVCGTARTGDFTNSASVIFSLCFDRDEEFFAAAGVSKKVKIFDYQALCNESIDIHYPVAEMSNESKLSCICWNTYIQNYLASTDYDGVVKLWDASTGQEISKYTEHERRAWSVDFSQLDPTKLASGSDDCSVRLWSINEAISLAFSSLLHMHILMQKPDERNSLCSIRNVANVCCVQFSPHSSHLLAFGSADYKIYCYDIRNANVPWCTLAGHEKAVSYVKFLDSETLVSASTDNTLKLWDLKQSSAIGLSTDACKLTYKGHTNEKNFVGLSVADGYIACGSETNEVFTYYKSLPMPITSHKFGSIDPVTAKYTDDPNGQFVSSVCWRNKSQNLVAANSSGCIKAKSRKAGSKEIPNSLPGRNQDLRKGA
ncbi:hypothetical protein V2J09_004804 [Rumex salicifolius]